MNIGPGKENVGRATAASRVAGFSGDVVRGWVDGLGGQYYAHGSR